MVQLVLEELKLPQVLLILLKLKRMPPIYSMELYGVIVLELNCHGLNSGFINVLKDLILVQDNLL